MCSCLVWSSIHCRPSCTIFFAASSSNGLMDWFKDLVGGLEHAFADFPYIGNVIIPTDELHHFSEGQGSTTNQYCYCHDLSCVHVLFGLRYMGLPFLMAIVEEIQGGDHPFKKERGFATRLIISLYGENWDFRQNIQKSRCRPLHLLGLRLRILLAHFACVVYGQKMSDTWCFQLHLLW